MDNYFKYIEKIEKNTIMKHSFHSNLHKQYSLLKFTKFKQTNSTYR